MADGQVNVVGLSSPSKSGKTNWKVIGAIIGVVVLILGIVAGILLVKQQQDIREKAQIVSCTDSTVEQCPIAGQPDTLRSCDPPKDDGSPEEVVCDENGKIATCGQRDYCCPLAGSSWTTDMSACAEKTLVISDLVSDREIACAQGFTDTFDTIDTSKWQKCGDGVSVSSGVLVIKRDEPGATTSTCQTTDALSTRESFSGDFVVQLDITDVAKSGDGGGGAVISFITNSSGTNGLQITRGRKNKNQNKTFYISAILATGSGSSETLEPQNLPSGKVSLKVERKDGVVSIYTKTGAGGYSLLKKFENTLTGTVRNIYLSAMNTEFTASEYVTVKYDNFSISCSEVIPSTSPSISPSPSTSGVPTVTPTSTNRVTTTPTSTSRVTATPTSAGSTTRTSTPRSTTSSAPIPETGTNWPTVLGVGFGILMIIASLALAL